MNSLLPTTKSNKLNDDLYNDMMADPEEIAPVAIQNLLHIDLETRKKGFLQIRSQWDIKFREYLWKAIEEEKNKGLQAQMVLFAIEELETRSLRKMIRYVEQDQLHPKARNHVISYYLLYEDNEVREALIKSLKRRGETYKFVCSLLRKKLPHGYETSSLQSLVTEVLDPGIPDQYRKEMVITLFSQYFKREVFQLKLSDVIWDLLYQDSSLHHFILEEFYLPKPGSAAKEEIPPKRFLLWNSWIWSIPGERIEFNEYLDLLSEDDLFIIKSFESNDSRVQKDLIKLMTRLPVTSIPKGGSDETYIAKLYTVWDVVGQNQWSDMLMELGSVTKESLDREFDELLEMDTAENMLFSEFVALEGINPHDLIARLYAYLPRSYLISKIFDDIPESIRIMAADAINSPDFFVQKESTTSRLIGSPYLWVDLMTRVIRTFQTAQSASFFGELTALVYTLVNLLESYSDDVLARVVEESLAHQSDQIEELSGLPYGLPLYFKLKSYLDEEGVIITADHALTQKQQVVVFKDLLDELSDPVAFESLINIIHMNNYTAQYQILDYLNKQINENLEFDVAPVGTQLYSLAKALTESTDVRIRTRSHLIKSELDRFDTEQEEDTDSNKQ